MSGLCVKAEQTTRQLPDAISLIVIIQQSFSGEILAGNINNKSQRQFLAPATPKGDGRMKDRITSAQLCSKKLVISAKDQSL